MESETTESKGKEKQWYEQLADWYKSTEKTFSEIKRATGIPKTTLGTYLHCKVKNLDRISPERRNILYNLTGLECLKYEGLRIEIGEPRKIERLAPEVKGDIEKINQEKKDLTMLVKKTGEKLTGMQKLEAGLLKVQQYRPSVQERADAIMEIIEVLSEEADYFRTAPYEEKKLMSERLKKDSESFVYMSKILNILHSGEAFDTWMMLTQPPSKLRNIIKKGK